MPVTAIGEYAFSHNDSVDKFHGNQIIYIGWDHHTMINAPMAFPAPKGMLFKDIITTFIPAAFDQHPDFKNIKWDEVIWLRDDDVFTPNMEANLEGNGFVHKAVIRFKTPGLNGIAGSGS